MGSFVYRGAKLVLGQKGCDTYDKKRGKYLTLQVFCCRLVSMS